MLVNAALLTPIPYVVPFWYVYKCAPIFPSNPMTGTHGEDESSCISTLNVSVAKIGVRNHTLLFLAPVRAPKKVLPVTPLPNDVVSEVSDVLVL